MASAIHSWSTRPRLGTGSPDLGIQAFDYSSAFDTVDSLELDSKLRRIGACKLTRKWFQSYMAGGLQQVKWNSATSTFVSVEVGVRQGSILGPLIFIIISMDITKTLGNAIGYADDNSSWVLGKPVGELLKDMESSSERLVELSTRLKLSLNPQKTQLLWVGGPASCMLQGVSVAGIKVEPTDTIEILGFQINKRLSPAPYIASLGTSLAQRTGMLRRLRVSMPPHTLTMFAQGMFFGKLRVYANLAFNVRLDEADKRTKGADTIQVLINDVARIITGVRRSDHVYIRDLLDRAGIPSLNEVVAKASGLLAWNMQRPSHPMHNIFVESTLNSVTRSATAGLVKVTDAMESVGVRNAQRVWNRCPALRTAQSPRSARKALDEFIRMIPL